MSQEPIELSTDREWDYISGLFEDAVNDWKEHLAGDSEKSKDDLDWLEALENIREKLNQLAPEQGTVGEVS